MTKAIAILLAAAFAAALPAALPAQTLPARAATEVPFTLASARNVTFAKPLRVNGPPTPIVDKALARAFLVRVEVPAAVYDGLPPSIEPFLYIGERELRTYSIERPAGGRTLFVTYYLPGTADATTFDLGAPMVITTEHGRPAREPALYRSRADLKTFQWSWLRTP